MRYLIPALLFLVLAIPGVPAGMWLAAHAGSILLFPVPAAICITLACYFMAKAEANI